MTGRDGQARAPAELLPLGYAELLGLAGSYCRTSGRAHASADRQVHEAYLRLVRNKRMKWQGKTHFFAMKGRTSLIRDPIHGCSA